MMAKCRDGFRISSLRGGSNGVNEMMNVTLISDKGMTNLVWTNVRLNEVPEDAFDIPESCLRVSVNLRYIHHEPCHKKSRLLSPGFPTMLDTNREAKTVILILNFMYPDKRRIRALVSLQSSVAQCLFLPKPSS